MRRFTLAAALLGLIVAAQPPVQAQPPDGAVRAALDARLAKLPRATQVGLVVADVDSSQPWFAHNPDLPLKPASVQKLFVTAAALIRFGPDFAYRTPLYYHDGEVWVLGSGDPALGDDRISQRRGRASRGGPAPAAADLLVGDWARRVAEIARPGTVQRIVLDDSVFDDQGRHPDWPAEQYLAWYQAPVGGLNLNDNCLDVRVTVLGGRVDVGSAPALPAEFFVNRLTAGQKHAPRLTRAAGSDLFELRGTAARDAALDATTVNRPTVFFGHALQAALARQGVPPQHGVVRRRFTPEALSAARTLAVQATPLPDVLWRCNTFSQNLFAECLVKSLEAYNADGSRTGRPGTWEGGHALLRQELGRLGIDLAAAVLRDGSGLSHSNRLTAGQVVELLRAMRRHAHAGIFEASLAAAGEEGSMKRRFDDPLLRGRVRGKTGTLKGVSTLAGYVTRADGTVLVFGLLVNGDGGEQLAVDVCRILVQAGR